MKISLVFKLVILLVVLAMPLLVMADQPHSGATNNLNDFLVNAGYSPYDPAAAEGNMLKSVSLFISVFLSFLGIIFLILILYAGFLWMTSGGNEEQITKAKGMLKNSIIGLAIIISAYAITYFVIYWIGKDLYGVDMGGKSWGPE